MNDSQSLPPSSRGWPELQPGHVWLCGAGPGDVGLLTLHALNALKQADVIVHDALVQDEIMRWARPDAVRIYAGKRGGKPSENQADISLKLVELARAGKRVLRLKGGDPFVFGRGGEEAQTLVGHAIPFRIIPGISAGIGGLGYAGIPVTHREVNQSVCFVTGHDQNGTAPGSLDWDALSKGAQVLVIYMGFKHIDFISQKLIAAGRDPAEPVAVVANATLADQTVLNSTLGTVSRDLDASDLSPPAVICVGHVVSLGAALNWHEIETEGGT